MAGWKAAEVGGLHDLKSPVWHPTYQYGLQSGYSIDSYPHGFDPTFHRTRLKYPQQWWKKPRNIFVCSMADLFGAWVPDEWIVDVFAACAAAPWHNYLFLTKNPARYMDLAHKGILPSENNFWFGSTATKDDDLFWWGDDYNIFASIEPLLGRFDCTGEPEKKLDWVIIGAESGRRKGKVVPERAWIEEICDAADQAGVPVFMKDSLVPIMGEEHMRREFPAGLGKDSI